MPVKPFVPTRLGGQAGAQPDKLKGVISSEPNSPPDAKFTYNKKDLLVSKTGFSTNTGTKKYFKNTYEYLYDKRGNWIMKLIYRNDELYETTIRVFEYY